MQYFKTCSRCNGSGKYDRGTCFECNGRRAITCAKPAAPEFQVTAIYEDGVRRVMKSYRAKTAEDAIAKTLSARVVRFRHDHYRSKTKKRGAASMVIKEPKTKPSNYDNWNRALRGASTGVIK